MNLSPVLADDLAEAGFQTFHWSRVGPVNAADSTILDWSAREVAILVSTDKDFGQLLAQRQLRRPSVILIRDENVHPSHVGPLLVDILARFDEELTSGAIVSTRRGLHRVSKLPLAQE